MANLKTKGKWDKIKGKIKQSYVGLFDGNLVNFEVKLVELLKQKP